jgi:hypothetical protein
MRASLIAIAFLVSTGCGAPTESDVRADFLRARPGAQIVSLDVGEGDGATVYYHIRYRAAGDTVMREEEWQYLRQDDGSWVNTWRGPRTASPSSSPRAERRPGVQVQRGDLARGALRDAG